MRTRRTITAVTSALTAACAATASPLPAGAAVPVCSSDRSPALAARLSADIPAALRGRHGPVAVGVFDRPTHTRCGLAATTHFQSASVVKVTILAALLRRAEEARRGLTAQEQRLAESMITRSDNASATALWNEVGQAGIRHFLALAGMDETRIDESGYWGKTQITAGDQLILLKLLTFSGTTTLGAASRAYVLRLMAAVVPGQRWGTPTGAPAGVNVHVKNGWVDRSDGAGWRVNSLGAFDGHGKDYQIVVLTQGNPTEAYGHETIEGVARVIHRDLNS
ncbi:class A beta-lactamase-related serine hydrolase [Actinoallomurus purpureus]|uniref:serine hydrolase n=1 Tax=Actinoallomurus purpureus TaxID=478114 RepID=UPI0020924B28|nr:serine hydrolase [Actinoallomurus purpureus]MCO6003756.1 class A beta-lactamase-related serine hydrolase [Actinoallomurus purpureus]